MNLTISARTVMKCAIPYLASLRESESRAHTRVASTHSLTVFLAPAVAMFQVMFQDSVSELLVITEPRSLLCSLVLACVHHCCYPSASLSCRPPSVASRGRFLHSKVANDTRGSCPPELGCQVKGQHLLIANQPMVFSEVFDLPGPLCHRAKMR